MTMNSITYITALLAVVTFSSSSIVSPVNESGNFELLILHNNDMHARFEQTSQLSGACTVADREAGKCYGGFPRVAHVVKEARKAAASGQGPPVLYLNAGDTYTGTAWFTIYKWRIAAEFINALQPDAVSLGNHEFDEGVPGLTPFIKNLNSPVLACNLDLSKEPSLAVQHNLMSSIIFGINGTRIEVIGYLTPDTKFLALNNEVGYIEEVNAIRKEVARLKNEGVNIFIALGHSGFPKDLEIAKEVEDIDLVIGGHTHTFLWHGVNPDVEKPQGTYPTLVRQKSGRLVPVVQAYAYTKYLGKLHITFDAAGEVFSFDGDPILLDNSVPQDVEVLEIVHRYYSNIVKLTEVVVGRTSITLDGQSCRVKECNMGNMVTDAMVHKYASEYTGMGWTDAPIAVIQGGSIRASIASINSHVNITRGDLMTVLPFDGKTAKLSINGSGILQMLEHAVASYSPLYPSGPFLQLSGLKIEYDFKYPRGQRVTNVLVLCGQCEMPQYTYLDKIKEYNILMPSYISMGGDGFNMFHNLPSALLPHSQLDSTIEYISKCSPMYPALEGRIIIHNAYELRNSASVPQFSLKLS